MSVGHLLHSHTYYIHFPSPACLHLYLPHTTYTTTPPTTRHTCYCTFFPAHAHTPLTTAFTHHAAPPLPHPCLCHPAYTTFSRLPACTLHCCAPACTVRLTFVLPFTCHHHTCLACLPPCLPHLTCLHTASFLRRDRTPCLVRKYDRHRTFAPHHLRDATSSHLPPAHHTCLRYRDLPPCRLFPTMLYLLPAPYLPATTTRAHAAYWPPS